MGRGYGSTGGRGTRTGLVQAVVIYESLTGNTAKAGRAIAADLTAQGLPDAGVPDHAASTTRRCPTPTS